MTIHHNKVKMIFINRHKIQMKNNKCKIKYHQ